MSEKLLSIDDVRVTFPHDKFEKFHAVNGVSLEVEPGETLGIVGESGSGKTMLALSMMGLVPRPGIVDGGNIHLLGQPIDRLSEKQLSTIRGRDVGMVFQDPMTGLNPVRKVGSLLIESIQRHRSRSRAEARDLALNTFIEVGIPSPEVRLDSYPHQLSGGLRQRVMIALALVNHPPLIIADEPTTALDATIQAQILELLKVKLSKSALILITHDLGVAAEICDRVAVMYHGKIMELGFMNDVLDNPAHPYTAGLLAAAPRFDWNRPDLEPIPGSPPEAGSIVPGCAFKPRCGFASPACEDAPNMKISSYRELACHHPLFEEFSDGY